MKNSTKEQTPQPYNLYWCDTCKSAEMSKEEIVKHLTEKHGIDTKKTKCMRQMICHVDSREWFKWKYELTFAEPKVVLINESLDLRREDDLMRYA